MAQSAEAGGTTVTVHTLAEAMSAPSGPPDVVVIERNYRDEMEENVPNVAEDLWLSSADGRFSSPPVPIRVGPLHKIQTFHVHRDILLRAEWFRKALCGEFKEAEEQAIDLPEEDPAIFHFLVAFLYEGRYEPIIPAANVLEPSVDKGKGPAVESAPEPEAAGGSDSGSRSGSSDSENSSGSPRPFHGRRRNRPLGAAASDQARGKHPGLHRPGCGCPRCLDRQDAERCRHCGLNRLRPGAPPPAGRRMPPMPYPARPSGWPRIMSPPRIKGEDLRTWLLAYELNIDVYICANRLLMDDFRKAVMRSCVDMLETAGQDAACPDVLRLCKKLYHGVPETDALLKMVLARVGFLQALLWKTAPEETAEFLVGNPEISAAILRETVARHETDSSNVDFPSMEQPGDDFVIRSETPPPVHAIAVNPRRRI
ncbi:hypothetical protein FZEAL_1486 [Fusarium zealandicum]|uniref:BTB domain-containing protein n=1 Tax=Fusarium zealandicum TaxID=1053134 RepID=A0A8H4USQ5_9HYPO|nr:hypothetical protein FZEAL_1486 [Fusarium zealandicum]